MSNVKMPKRKYSSKNLKRAMNLFPPLLVNRIRIAEADSEFKKLRVTIKYSWLNKNIQKSIFGGSIFSAIDPFYAVMYWQIFNTRNIPMIIWIKKAEIDYIKTATSNLYMDFELSENDIDNAVSALKENEKYEVWHTVKVYNSHSELCTESRVLVYIRNKYEHPLNNS
jgi:hypothetical protein